MSHAQGTTPTSDRYFRPILISIGLLLLYLAALWFGPMIVAIARPVSSIDIESAQALYGEALTRLQHTDEALLLARTDTRNLLAAHPANESFPSWTEAEAGKYWTYAQRLTYAKTAYNLACQDLIDASVRVHNLTRIFPSKGSCSETLHN